MVWFPDVGRTQQRPTNIAWAETRGDLVLAGNSSEYSWRDLHLLVMWIEMNRRMHLSGLNATMRLSGEKQIDNRWSAHVLGYVAKLRKVWFTESFSRCVVVWRKALRKCRMTTDRRRLRPPRVPLLIPKRFSCTLIVGCDNIIHTCAPLKGETCASMLGLFDGRTKLSGY